MPQSLLYYPTINIEDGEWLRSAAFYWDEVCSIVPYEGFDDFSPEIRYMLERRQYRPIFPQEMLNSSYANDFVETVKSRMRPTFSKRDEFNRRIERVHREKIYDPHTSTLVHYKKFPNEFAEKLIEIGNITTDESGWIEMDARLANVYMKTLAEYVALHDARDVAISSDKASKISEIYQPTKLHQKSQTLSISLQGCLPVPAMDVPFETLLDFKENRRSDLYELQVKIQKLEWALAHCESQAEVKSIIQAFKASWEHELEQAEKLFRSERISMWMGALVAFVGAVGDSSDVLTWAQDMGGISWSSSAVGAAIGMYGLVAVGVQARNYRNKIKKDQRDKGFAYIIGAQNNRLLRAGNIEMV